MAASSRDCAVYRSKDPLKNFKIRVKVEKCLSEYPSTPVLKDGNTNSLEMKEFSCLDSLKTSKLELVEDRVISWQEKIFSDSEIKKYSNEGECQTALQKKYFRLLQDVGSNSRCRKLLFTYVDEDEPTIDHHQLTVPVEYPTKINQNVTELRNRRSGKSGWETFNAINKSIVNNHPSPMQQKLNHCLLTPVQVMHIMATVKSDGGSDLVQNSSEVLLATITVDSKGIITITPDFNSGKNLYRFNIMGMREVYYYTLEHASNEMNQDEKEQDAKLQLSSLASSVVKPVSYEFEMADPNLLRMHIFGEIVSAKQFEYDGVSVNCFLDLPQFWTSEGDQTLYHVTQTCKTKSKGSDEIAYLCYPFEYKIACPVKSLMSEESGNLPRWPSIGIQVMSRDSWHRFRTEGYGYIKVPYTPGSYSFEIKTWRPVVPSLCSQLRRLFIGGSPELMDLSQVAVPSTLERSYLSRFGMRSETSGVVCVRLHIIHQCQKSSIEFDQYYTSVLSDAEPMQRDVADVIEAFHRVRQRMLAARESIQL